MNIVASSTVLQSGSRREEGSVIVFTNCKRPHDISSNISSYRGDEGQNCQSYQSCKQLARSFHFLFLIRKKGNARKEYKECGKGR